MERRRTLEIDLVLGGLEAHAYLVLKEPGWSWFFDTLRTAGGWQQEYSGEQGE